MRNTGQHCCCACNVGPWTCSGSGTLPLVGQTSCSSSSDKRQREILKRTYCRKARSGRSGIGSARAGSLGYVGYGTTESTRSNSWVWERPAKAVGHRVDGDTAIGERRLSPRSPRHVPRAESASINEYSDGLVCGQ